MKMKKKEQDKLAAAGLLDARVDRVEFRTLQAGGGGFSRARGSTGGRGGAARTWSCMNLRAGHAADCGSCSGENRPPTFGILAIVLPAAYHGE
jgi:hypothetical protein